jgi:hypothetical protein
MLRKMSVDLCHLATTQLYIGWVNYFEAVEKEGICKKKKKVKILVSIFNHFHKGILVMMDLFEIWWLISIFNFKIYSQNFNTN